MRDNHNTNNSPVPKPHLDLSFKLTWSVCRKGKDTASFGIKGTKSRFTSLFSLDFSPHKKRNCICLYFFGKKYYGALTLFGGLFQGHLNHAAREKKIFQNVPFRDC
jgi:hypothetical protein